MGAWARIGTCALATLLALGACTGETSTPVAAPPATSSTSATSTPASTPPPPTPSRADAAVAATDEAAEERSGATLGVAVLDRTTGRVATNDDGSEGFNAASVAKLFTVLDVLVRREAGQVEVSSSDERRIRAALGPSDDAAMNTLWSQFGGSAGITRVVEMLDLPDTRVPEDSSQWGEVTTSARDVATVYGYVLERLAAPDRELVLDALAAAPATAADGFDQAFGLLEPEGRGQAAAKQGWLCCLQNSIELHSAGLPDPGGRYVLVLMSNQPFGYDAARGVLDDAATAARATLAAS